MDMIIYHASCNDGFCAATLAHWAYPDAEFVPAQYGQDPPDVRGKDVLIADFSYKRGVMLVMASEAKSLTILDHHKTAAADLDGFADEAERGYGLPRPRVVFDMDKSGGRLTWEFINRHDAYSPEPPACPWIVDYTEDRDLWRFALPHSREVNAALASYPHDFEVWDRLAAEGYAPLIPEGRAILRYQDTVIERHVRNAVEVEIAGHKVPAVNATVLFSEIAGRLAESAPFGAAWFDRADGKRQFSLRSRGEDGADVSEIARRFGGGGHRNAAGFEAMPGDLPGAIR